MNFEFLKGSDEVLEDVEEDFFDRVCLERECVTGFKRLPRTFSAIRHFELEKQRYWSQFKRYEV